MSKVIFARPRHNYDSYNDLYRLIELSGYPLIYADDIDPDSDNCYIVTLLNGETQAGWPDARAEIILWDLEWRVGAPPQVPGVSRVWASDMWYADQIGAQYVPMRSHCDLIPGVLGGPAQYDLAAMMYTGPYRRNNLINRLTASGLRVAGPSWGLERAVALQTSRAMLHIHQHDHVATVAPLRWALAAAARRPVISEAATMMPPIPGTLWLPYANFVNFIEGAQAALRQPEMLDDMGMALWAAYCVDADFGDSVEEAL